MKYSPVSLAKGYLCELTQFVRSALHTLLGSGARDDGPVHTLLFVILELYVLQVVGCPVEVSAAGEAVGHGPPMTGGTFD